MREEFNKLATHPLQSFEWGEFRKKTGIQLISKDFQLTIHKIPHTPFKIGYLPKGSMPTLEMINQLKIIGKENNCIFIQLEPNVEQSQNAKLEMQNLGLIPSFHPLFTKFTFQLDLTKSEEELLKNMHPKTRYNIKVAQKHNVTVGEDNSDNAFERFWELTEETTRRQGFFAHTKKYHQAHWETFSHKTKPNTLSSHILVGNYNGKILTTLMLFVFNDTLYYPYGASSDEDRNVMHSTYTMWQAILFGKKLGLKKFDMWGAANVEDPLPSDPYYGFHRFKQGFGAKLVEFVGSYDLVINKPMYQVYKIVDKLRWFLLKRK